MIGTISKLKIKKFPNISWVLIFLKKKNSIFSGWKSIIKLTFALSAVNLGTQKQTQLTQKKLQAY